MQIFAKPTIANDGYYVELGFFNDTMTKGDVKAFGTSFQLLAHERKVRVFLDENRSRHKDVLVRQDLQGFGQKLFELMMTHSKAMEVSNKCLADAYSTEEFFGDGIAGDLFSESFSEILLFEETKKNQQKLAFPVVAQKNPKELYVVYSAQTALETKCGEFKESWFELTAEIEASRLFCLKSGEWVLVKNGVEFPLNTKDFGQFNGLIGRHSTAMRSREIWQAVFGMERSVYSLVPMMDTLARVMSESEKKAKPNDSPRIAMLSKILEKEGLNAFQILGLQLSMDEAKKLKLSEHDLFDLGLLK